MTARKSGGLTEPPPSMHPEHGAVLTASSHCPQLRACGGWVHKTSLNAVDDGVIQQKGESGPAQRLMASAG